MDKESVSHKKGYFLMFISGIIWGSGGFIIAKMNEYGASSMITAFTMCAFAIPVMAIYMISTKGFSNFKISKNGLIYSLVLGIICKGIFKMIYDASILLIGMSTSTILLYLSPAFVAIMMRVFFGEKLKGFQILAIILNLIGCVLMVTGGDFSVLMVFNFGIVLGLISGFIFALNTVVGKFSTDEDDSNTINFYSIIFGTIIILPFAELTKYSHLFFDTGFMFWAIINAILVGTFSNIFYLDGLSTGINPSKATIISSIEVPISVIMGVMLLNEHINAIKIIGIIIMIFSIILINLNPSKIAEEMLE